MLSNALLFAAAFAAALPGPAATPPLPFRWGTTGHEISARAAARGLPDQIPAFFRDAGDHLVYLDPEPDRWRNGRFAEMDHAYSPDHYIDLENVPKKALDAPDRYAFIHELYAAGITNPQVDAGFLPFRIVELYQRVVTEWRLWRKETDPERKGWIEARIVNDAGILGHYVTDAANPHHTTVHYNGWSEDVPNPEGYTTDRDFHSRFESAFVEAQIRQSDVDRRMPSQARSVAGHARAAVMGHIDASHAQVKTLYELEKRYGFDPRRPTPETRAFAADRLAAGADMLRNLWWSAWLESATGQ